MLRKLYSGGFGVDLNACIQYLFPGSEPLIDYVLADDGDGSYIAEWNLSSVKPTIQELKSIESEAIKSSIKRHLEIVVDRHLNEQAAERGYDSIHTCRINAGSGHQKYDAEGQACQNLYNITWDKCWEILADVNSGVRPVPTENELISELPSIVWP